MAIILMIINSIFGLGEGIFIKKYNSKHNVGGFIFTALVSLFSMLFFLITDKGGFNAPASLWGYAIIAGVLYCTASFLTYVALQCGSFALSNLILSYVLIFNIVYGLVFLKEEVSVLTYVGMALIMVSLYLTRAKADKEAKKTTGKWLICIFLSFVGCGIFGVISRMQQIKYDNACTNEFMIISIGLSTIVLMIAGIAKDGKNLKYILRHGGLFAVGAGMSNGIKNMLTLVVNTLIPISVASPLGTGIKMGMSFIVSKLVFKEQFLKRQIVGVFIGTVAVVLMNIKI